MRPRGSTRPIIVGLILAIGITLTLPYFAFGAGRSYGFGFYPLVLSIQQFQPEPTTEPTEPAKKKGIYVEPRWVDGGHGVEVLQPGYWTEPKQAEKR
jgi:hypothetical protein